MYFSDYRYEDISTHTDINTLSVNEGQIALTFTMTELQQRLASWGHPVSIATIMNANLSVGDQAL